MPLTARKNQYLGINAHLNSQLQQAKGGWEAFHSHFIGEIHVQLMEQLRGTGYVAKLEAGLQIRRRDEKPYTVKSDVGIWDTTPRSSYGQMTYPATKILDAIAAVTHPERYEDTEYFMAVGLYEWQADETPVAWIEFLSPTNKRGGRHADDYLEKRDRLLEIRTCKFIEIDFLHQSPPTITSLADYTHKSEDSSAYRVMLIDTQQGIKAGKVYVEEFGVEMPIPTFSIPLHGEQKVDLELNKIYQVIFHRVGFGINEDTLVDYVQLPVYFQSYRLVDQQKIVKRMLAVVDATTQGVDLEGETVPLPIDEARLQASWEKGQLPLPAIPFEIFK